MTRMSVAVVGGGMFGVATAIELAEAGIQITLFERKKDILSAASYSNPWRLHRGYHYPLSDKTAASCQKWEPEFRDQFEEAVITNEEHYYAIASDSRVSHDEYVEFFERHGLSYDKVDLELVSEEKIVDCFWVAEDHVNPDCLRRLCWEKLEERNVEVRLNSEVTGLEDVDAFDYEVLATYASINSLLPANHSLRQKYLFEICEVPVIQLPDEYLGKDIIVVYGPFMSVDPWGNSDLFTMGDYVHMVHNSNVGFEPEVPNIYSGILNKGLIEEPPVSNFKEFQEHGKQYIIGVENAKYVGSMFTIRSKLPDVGDTDARPSLVRQDRDVISLFGGKLGTSVGAAKEVRDKIQSQ